ncbi:NAD(P)-dependent oxidoreductase [Streptomyces silvisoli]|uniref:NAD(P)-dependent oxidoreductase n=1 Tax=Streptomyces silvisoli TaxID=3034235 RepID=A0ABT5ZNR8_9ACTN|nr:NAD(P)-dependent oxidoreductase [Streptomyces silvisoli]MDF3290648.1 NAD(P)-dependent oxidoreductase [Streptomyces silvisoli]
MGERVVMPECRGYPRLSELVRSCPGGASVKVFTDPCPTPELLEERIRGADTVLHFFHAPPLAAEALLAERPRRVVVAGPHGGPDISVLQRAGIEVYDTPGLAADSVAEFAITLLLMLAHRIPSAVGAAGDIPAAGRELTGKTLGIVGWGRIGARTARLAQGIGMRVAAWSPSLDEETARAAGVRRLPLDTLLGGVDAVSLHLRQGPGTRQLIDARRLALLGSGTLLVNTARAGLLDMAELRRRLAAGLVGGVALDVAEVEPLPPDDPLRTDPRVLATPHMAWMTDEAVVRFLTAALAFATTGRDTGTVRRVA